MNNICAKTWTYMVNQFSKVLFQKDPTKGGRLKIRIETFGKNKVTLYEDTFIEICKRYMHFKQFKEKEDSDKKE